ncbi:hypothetical protein CPB85DRAFT_1278308 [Mucidula mucida]|nr:hypothetical protein CPB85DRAFT_1278308 [Mucidula mucida]
MKFFRTFAVSTLTPSFGVLPQCGTSTFPLHTILNPLGMAKRGPSFVRVMRWAGCGGRCDAGCNVLPLDV